MENISLKDFLKTYTAISIKFIDEYYKFYELCDNNTFGIDAELLIKYLEYKDIDKFYERLRNNYVLNKDYIITRILKPGNKNAKRVNYFLSLDCFEKIIMLSRTKKGDAVRDYFIVLRKFINYYKTHFANKINKLATSKKYVYIILVDKNKNIQKFGRTINMRKRLYSYATGKEKHPDIKFILIVNDPKKVEKCTKIFIDDYKFKNKQELYKIDHDLLKSIVFDCANMNKTIEEKIKESDKYDSYIVYDEFEEKEYLDLKNNIIGYEKIQKSKSVKSSKKSKSVKSSKKSKSVKSSK